MLQALASDEITVIRAVHYHQYDTYFFFDDPSQGRLRYREDEFLDEQNAVVERPGAADADRAVARSGVWLGAAVPLALPRAGDALAPLLPRVLQAGSASARSRRIAAAGWSAIVASSSTCTSIAC